MDVNACRGHNHFAFAAQKAQFAAGRGFGQIACGEPLTPEARLDAGRPVRVRSGAFLGMEGVVIRRANETRLLVAVNFLQRGASVLLDDCQVEPL